ncbi:MAG: hypothetical protein M3256_22625 [Actinomycetota bacterium]|nr:hypothetical protein [Actinomycetota bacterium]
MTDPLDTEIRRLMGELEQRAPLPPTTGELHLRGQPPPRHRRGSRLIGLAALFVMVAAVLSFQPWHDRSSTRVATGFGPTSVPLGLAGTIPGEAALPDPTFVTIASPPQGLRFIEGGSQVLEGRSEEILLADSNGRSVRLIGLAPGSCGAGLPVTTLREATGTATAPSRAAGQIAPTSAEAVFVGSGNGGALHWCEQGKMDINLITGGFDESGTRRLATTVQLIPGTSDRLTIDVPAGFVAGRPTTQGRLYKLAFRPDDASSSRPQLTVMVASAWTTDLGLLKARAGGSTSDVDAGGRKGFILQLPGGSRYQSLTVVYDDRTIVTLQGDGLTPDQLVAAAASIRPADPSLAPDITGDAGRCKRLGLCG